MSWSRIGIAFVCCLLLGGLWMLDRQRREEAFLDRLSEDLLLPREFDLRRLNRIEIENRIHEETYFQRLALERAGEREWRVVEPLDRPASEYRVEHFLTNLSNARRSNIFKGEATDGNGLTSPTIQARFLHDDPDFASPLEFEFGAPSSYTGNFFARATDMPGKVFTVSRATFDAFAVPFPVFVDLALVEMPAGGRIATIELTNRHGTVVLQASEEGWTASGALEGSIDAKAVREFVDMLPSLRAARTMEPEPGLELGETTTRLVLSDGITSPTGVTVGQPFPGQPDAHLARRDDGAYLMKVDAPIFEALQVQPMHWLDRDLLPVARADIRMIRVQALGRSLSVRREDPDAPWRIPDRPKRAVDRRALDALLGRLAGLRATGIVPIEDVQKRLEARAILFTPRDTHYQIETADGSRHRLRIALNPERSVDDQAFALRGEDTHIFLLPQTLGFNLLLSPESLLDRAIFSAVADRVEEIVFDGPDIEEVTVRREASELDPGWTSPELPRESATELGRRLLELRFSRVLPPDRADFEGLEALYTVRLLGAGGEEIDRLVAYPPTGQKDELEVRVELSDDTKLYLDRTSLAALERLVRQGRALQNRP